MDTAFYHFKMIVLGFSAYFVAMNAGFTLALWLRYRSLERWVVFMEIGLMGVMVAILVSAPISRRESIALVAFMLLVMLIWFLFFFNPFRKEFWQSTRIYQSWTRKRIILKMRQGWVIERYTGGTYIFTDPSGRTEEILSLYTAVDLQERKIIETDPKYHSFPKIVYRLVV